MITLLDKQKIILKYFHDGKSQREIQKETGISRKTIRKYINEYETKKTALLKGNNVPDEELIQSIIEKPNLKFPGGLVQRLVCRNWGNWFAKDIRLVKR